MPVGTLVYVLDEANALMFAFSQALGTVVETNKLQQTYGVWFLDSERYGVFPWHAVDAVIFVVLEGLTRNKSLNGQVGNVEAVVAGSDGTTRVCVRLDTDQLVKVRHTCIRQFE